ncbi:MAG: TIGR00730 family Rossman fold protein [Alphaproteobacteria bacterium]
MNKLCVFCGSRSGDKPSYTETARTLGMRIAEHKHTLIYGGGHVGVMGAVAEGALSKGGHVVGIIPHHLEKKEQAFLQLPELEVVPHMYVRKNRMKELSDGFCLLPGGFGSLDEIFELITLKQLQRHNKPIIIVNIDGFWDSMVAMINDIVNGGFAEKDHLKLFTITNNIEDVVPIFEKELEEIGDAIHFSPE